MAENIHAEDVPKGYRASFVKTIEQKLFMELKEDYAFPNAVCRSLVECFTENLNLYFGSQRNGNQIIFNAAASDIPAGCPSDRIRTVPVKLTIVSPTDFTACGSGGQKELIKQRIKRLTYEAYDQGGLLTQTDLAILLGVSRRTIIRYIKEIEAEENIIVPTRGSMKDIGPGVSHKVKILTLYLTEYEYTDIKRRTRHSYEAIMQYIKEFSKFVLLLEEGYKKPALRMFVDCSDNLIDEYLALYEKFSAPEYQERMDHIRSIGKKKTNESVWEYRNKTQGVD